LRTNTYTSRCVFFYLDSEDLAIERVKARVLEGGHDIPKPVIIRRYFAGLRNLFKLYTPICDYWMLFDNSKLHSELIAEGYLDNEVDIKNIRTFETIKSKIQDDKKG
jgi:predicted ABC-type ATPase